MIAHTIQLALAPVFARAFAKSGALAPIAAVAVIISSFSAVKSERDAARLRVQILTEDVDQISRLTEPGSLIVVRRRHTLYTLRHTYPSLASRLAYLDATPVHPTDRFAIIERDVARAHQRIYGFPRIESTTSLANIDSFYLMEYDPLATPTPLEFPDDSISRVGNRLFRLERR